MIIVGEAPGELEVIEGRPFVGPSGKLLDDLLKKASINREDCLLTNVFEERPPRNDVSFFFEKGKSAYPSFNGKHLKKEHEHHLERLYSLIDSRSDNLVILLGATALWALTGKNGIKNYRGVILPARSKKVIASYHPAAVLRDFTLRPILFADLVKAKANDTPEKIRRKTRSIWIAESPEDVRLFGRTKVSKADSISFDTETEGEFITHISFAVDDSTALCVEFKPLGSTFKYSIEQEAEIWTEIQRWFLTSKTKVAQNSLYDLTHLANYGIEVKPPIEDTMLIAHADQPEFPKSLGFLGSLYLNEDAWKLLRVKSLDDEKSEE